MDDTGQSFQATDLVSSTVNLQDPDTHNGFKMTHFAVLLVLMLFVFQVDYELELKTLHDLVQVKVVSLLSDSDNSVKMAMLHHSIIKLAVLFGKQKGIYTHQVLGDKMLCHFILSAMATDKPTP